MNAKRLSSNRKRQWKLRRARWRCHFEYRTSWIQVQIQWHSPATMATTLRANRFTSDALFNLFDGDIPAHTVLTDIPIYSPERAAALTMSSRTEAKDVGCNDLMSIYENCFLFIWIADEWTSHFSPQMRSKMVVDWLRHFCQCFMLSIQNGLIYLTWCRRSSKRVRFLNRSNQISTHEALITTLPATVAPTPRREPSILKFLYYVWGQANADQRNHLYF